MRIFELVGFYDGGEEPEYRKICASLEESEAQMRIEIQAYTYKGECKWEFKINEVEL
jgi:hypothetical protein